MCCLIWSFPTGGSSILKLNFVDDFNSLKKKYVVIDLNPFCSYRRRPHTTRSPLYKRQIVLQRILSHAPSIKHHRIKQIQLGKPLETRYQLSNVQHGKSVEAKYHLRHAHLGKPTEKIQQERNVPISREKQDKVKLPGRKSTTNKHLTVQLLVRMLNALKQKPVEFTETEQMANDR